MPTRQCAWGLDLKLEGVQSARVLIGVYFVATNWSEFNYYVRRYKTTLTGQSTCYTSFLMMSASLATLWLMDMLC